MWRLGLCVPLGSGYFPTPAALWDWHSSAVLCMVSTGVPLCGLLYCTYRRWRNKGTHDVGFGWWEIRGVELTSEGQTSDYLEAYLLTNCEQHGQQSHQPSVLIWLWSFNRGSIHTSVKTVFRGQTKDCNDKGWESAQQSIYSSVVLLLRRKRSLVLVKVNKRLTFLSHQWTIITLRDILRVASGWWVGWRLC